MRTPTAPPARFTAPPPLSPPPALEPQPQRRAGEAEDAPEPVLDIASVGEMQQRGVIDEEDEGRRRRLHLGAIEHLQLPAAHRRRTPLPELPLHPRALLLR